MFLPQSALDLGNFIPLEQQAGEHHVNVDTPVTASTEEPAARKGCGGECNRPLSAPWTFCESRRVTLL
jgi:hypothetical protein